MSNPGEQMRMEKMSRRRALCETCVFFILHEVMDGHGKAIEVKPWCRRYPEIHRIQDPGHHWCGEWRPRKDMP